MATPDTNILIIGAGMSGLGLAVQLIRKHNFRDFCIVEKGNDVGGTWLANTYPGCGCDVASHFYSYSFALNPNWSRKFSMREEIQAYFKSVAEEYDVLKHVRFGTVVERARWDEEGQVWEVSLRDSGSKEVFVRRCRVLVSGVGSLSVPRKCEIAGKDEFEGKLFHSAQWDHSFDWKDKDVVVLGNGCSATQFVPVMAPETKSITQFARQAQYLAERPNPIYSPSFKALMKYTPFAMRLYRLKLYVDMEKDFASMETVSGASIRRDLAKENISYVHRTAPKKYWSALIPPYEIGCKRKVMDTDYLATLHRPNVELISSDPVVALTPTGVRTSSGKGLRADAIILATGFQVARMLFPMEIIGANGVSLQQHWDETFSGAPQAYFGTCIPNFPNFFTLMGPNTVTGHLSVIYTVECQINFILRLISPLLTPKPTITTVSVKPDAAAEDSAWLQRELKKLVWASGCSNWALDEGSGSNVAMYPGYQFGFWLRSVFIPEGDFEWVDGKGESKSVRVGGWKTVRQVVVGMAGLGAIAWGVRMWGGTAGLVRQGREMLKLRG